MRSAFEQALGSIDPGEATADAVAGLAGDRIDVLAIGKASLGMLDGARRVLGERIGSTMSVSDQPDPDGDPTQHVGEHPFPREGSLTAGRAALDMARSSTADRLLVLISGGGSSIAVAPPPGVTVVELAHVIQQLMDSAVPIRELNLVRRSLSQIKNGRLLASARVPVTSLIISDVIDEPPSTVASGPTLHEEVDPDEVEAIVEGAGATMTPAMRNWIRRPVDPVAVDHSWSVIASGRTAAAALANALDATPPESGFQGRAAEMARRFVTGSPAGFTVGYGETTVEVTGNGKGGRNTEAALAAALMLDGTDDVVFGAFATDGVDGSSGAAGAVVDGGTAGRIRAGGIDPARALEMNDSATALSASGDLVVTGPTGTNVADLWVSWRGR